MNKYISIIGWNVETSNISFFYIGFDWTINPDYIANVHVWKIVGPEYFSKVTRNICGVIIVVIYLVKEISMADWVENK